MSWKSIACVAALGAIAAPAMALPSIQVVRTGAQTGRIDVITTSAGSVGAEVSLVLAGATLNSAVVNSAVFDTANPGDNPFIAGSPVGGDTTGLSAVTGGTSIFASFGSGNLAVGTHKLLDFTFSGNAVGATATGDGFVASIGVLTNVAADVEPIGPSNPPPVGDFNSSGSVGDADLTLLLANWGATVPPTPSGWTSNLPTAPNVGDDELTKLLSTWGQSASSAVSIPEPTAAVLGLIGLACLSFRRSA